MILLKDTALHKLLNYNTVIVHAMQQTSIIIFLLLILLCWNCNVTTPQTNEESREPTTTLINLPLINSTGYTVEERILTPAGFERSKVLAGSFQAYLRTLPLKPVKSLVRYYNGATKANTNVYEAVVDLNIGTKDLHQCADAIMRLRAEHLWHQGAYDEIHFNFTNGFRADYSEWMNGKRMKVDGNKTWWSSKAQPSNTYEDFWNYMELIFTYAGTASLERELLPIDMVEAEIGDVIIQGGHPGHAVIIIDKAVNTETGTSAYLLAQSFMPSQEIQVLKNPLSERTSPWYIFDDNQILTPEWRFRNTDFRRF